MQMPVKIANPAKETHFPLQEAGFCANIETSADFIFQNCVLQAL